MSCGLGLLPMTLQNLTLGVACVTVIHNKKGKPEMKEKNLIFWLLTLLAKSRLEFLPAQWAVFCRKKA